LDALEFAMERIASLLAAKDGTEDLTSWHGRALAMEATFDAGHPLRPRRLPARCCPGAMAVGSGPARARQFWCRGAQKRRG